MTPRTGAVVLCRDRPIPTAETLEALLAQEPQPDVLVLVDNDATPEVRALLEEAAARHPDAEVLDLERNYGACGGFEKGVARLLERPDLDYVIGFDDDATPLPGCIAGLLEAARSLPDAGEIGAMSHTREGTLAWPMHVVGEPGPALTVDDVRAIARRREALEIPNNAWHGIMFPVPVLRRHGNVWGDLFLQYEDIELGMRFRRAGLRCYMAPEAECIHPAPPPARPVRILGRQIDVTAQSAAKEYLSLRNGLVVRSRYEGLRFWYGTGPFVLLRGLLSSLALERPRLAALRHVFLQGIMDAVRGRLGPPPPATAALDASRGTRARSAGS
ncbi:MAG: rhamnopyranosyl-N-acetylglucosaminyl-diphospho-decaprenol beta,3/1,4-galactofuranosyltransferase [Thermoleophilaceae bacterium]|nr:rhamnopyranosyl-N-acetylglucosaminyl-diphospho-decaprenol beta,3/1,4-galactofuranosyltransferase [Thermoleophilaceae bacterium]